MSEPEAPEREQAPAATQPSGSALSDGGPRDLSSRVNELRRPAMIALAIYAVLLIVLNTHSVSISFVFFTFHTALLVLIAVAGLTGFAGGYLVRRHKDAEKPDG